jgi:hypothetical protein
VTFVLGAGQQPVTNHQKIISAAAEFIHRLHGFFEGIEQPKLFKRKICVIGVICG